ncbi:MAG: DUF2497 domain-containing protein [Rhizomicrobium sp.]
MASSPQHEPTMEEILASIRKIISEDSTEAPAAAAAEPKPAPVAAAPAPVEADVLELTQEVPEEPAPAPMAAPAPEPLVIAPLPENDVVFETIEEPAVMTEAPVSSHDDIFSDKTRKALDDTFANIDEPEYDAPQRDYGAAPIAPVSGLTVEAVFERAVREAFDPVVAQWLGSNTDMIVDRMKPLIREWMDEHFPALLEGAVRNEVARVVKARGAKR